MLTASGRCLRPIQKNKINDIRYFWDSASNFRRLLILFLKLNWPCISKIMWSNGHRLTSKTQVEALYLEKWGLKFETPPRKYYCLYLRSAKAWNGLNESCAADLHPGKKKSVGTVRQLFLSSGHIHEHLRR